MARLERLERNIGGNSGDERRSVRIVDIREGRGKRNNWPTFAEEWGQN